LLADKIVERATVLFLDSGFEAVSIDEIAARTGISKRTFYARFGGKSDLFTAVVIRFVETRIALLDEIGAKEGPVSDCLEAVAGEFLRILTRPDAIALDRIVTAEVGRFPELGRTLYDFGASRATGVVQRLLERALAAGEIVPVDLHHAAEHFMFAAVIGPMRMAALGIEGSRMTPTRMKRIRASVHLFIAGMAHRP
jgi:TetR/AcrR family transcriptional repressor of mexJK operon